MSRLPTTRLRAAGILTAITMTAFLAACSSGSSDDGTAADAGGSSAGGGSDAGASDGSATSPGAVSRKFGGQSAEDTSTSSGSGSGDAPTTTPAMQRAVISNGAVSLSTDDVKQTRQEVQRIVDTQAGNVSEENTESDEKGGASYARLVVRVPSAKFAATMEALEGTATLRSSTRGSEDVTTQVIDNDVRVRAQEASLKRVELLLSEADSLKDVIWIESQLTSRQAELDSMKSQQSWLRDQTSLSTITIDISTQPVEKAEEDDDQPAGFLSGLDGGMRAMGATLVAVLTIVGALLPFAVVALVVGLPLWLVVRRRRSAAVPAEVADA